MSTRRLFQVVLAVTSLLAAAPAMAEPARRAPATWSGLKATYGRSRSPSEAVSLREPPPWAEPSGIVPEHADSATRAEVVEAPAGGGRSPVIISAKRLKAAELPNRKDIIAAITKPLPADHLRVIADPNEHVLHVVHGEEIYRLRYKEIGKPDDGTAVSEAGVFSYVLTRAWGLPDNAVIDHYKRLIGLAIGGKVEWTSFEKVHKLVTQLASHSRLDRGPKFDVLTIASR